MLFSNFNNNSINKPSKSASVSSYSSSEFSWALAIKINGINLSLN